MDLVQFFGRFHVLVLHLPLGILLMAACIEAYLVLKRRSRPTLLNVVWLWGAGSAIAAAILGYMLSLNGAYQAEAVFIHKIWGISVVAMALICSAYFIFLARHRVLLTLALIGAQYFTLFAAGHYGANMTHGPTFLVEYAPDTFRQLAGLPKHEVPRPDILNIDDADIYLDVVKPALKTRCYSCHNDTKAKGQLTLSTHQTLLLGGQSGPAIVAQKPQDSELYQRITLDAHDKHYMPADGKTPLSQEQVSSIHWWISIGAPAQGRISEFKTDKDSRKALAAVLGLSADKWPLPKITALPTPQRIALEQNGFIVKRIAKDKAYLTLRFNGFQRTLNDENIEALILASTHIASLNLSGTSLNNAQLKKLSALTQLIKLRIDKTTISSEGLSSLATLPHLKMINAYSTQVNDDIFEKLPKFSALEDLYLSMSPVSTEAAKHAQKQFPHINILTDSPSKKNN